MTQKEYTGPEFEIEFARAWLKYVKAGKVGIDPRRNWQVECGRAWANFDRIPECADDRPHRWKPAPKRAITIGYESHDGAEWISKELVAPEVEAPPMGTPIYLLDKKPEVEWEDRPWLVSWLNAGLVFLAREDAQAMADWLSVCRKGGQS